MNRNKLKTYAPQARRDFIAAVTDRAGKLGITAGKGKVHIEPVQVQGDIALIGGRAYPRKVAAQRRKLEERIHLHGFEQVIEAMAYTWFNRLMAIRFMEVNGYLDHGYRVLSHPEGKGSPEILEQAEHVDLPGLHKGRVIELKLAGDRDEELYRQLLIAQCNALSEAMPFLFERIDDETELLLPDNLLHSDSVIRRLVAAIPEEDWREIEIVGWLYQFYISEKKDQVIGKVVKSEDIPAATQLFTPNWIVKYLLQNSLGRQWLATYPDSALKGQMAYYIEPAEQSEEVKRQLAEITPKTLDPEAITVLDPACGSGHILVEAYELMKAIYQERGYRSRDIPALILTKNLYGLEIDDRAAQLAAFALMMKARADDRRIFERGVRPNVLAIQESRGLDAERLALGLGFVHHRDTEAQRKDQDFSGSESLSLCGADDIAELLKLFEHGKTFGSLITVPEDLAERLPELRKRVEVSLQGDMLAQEAARTLLPFVQQALFLAAKYDVVVANPPYMGERNILNSKLKFFIRTYYKDYKTNIYGCFIKKSESFCKLNGFLSLVTMHGWMFLSSFEALRREIINNNILCSMIHLGARAFPEIGGEIVQVAAFSIKKTFPIDNNIVFLRAVDGDEEYKRNKLLKKEDMFFIPQIAFKELPGFQLAYWISNQIRRIFRDGASLSEISKPLQGATTSDNERFVRYWHEVSITNLSFNCKSRGEAKNIGKKWFPFNKGGEYRKWSGNKEHVLNFYNDGEELKAFHAVLSKEKPGGRLKNQEKYFNAHVSWSRISGGIISVRFYESGFIFSDSGSAIFPEEIRDCLILCGLINSNASSLLLRVLSPSIHFQVEHISSLPLPPEIRTLPISNIEHLIKVSDSDWNSFETSWDFQSFPWLTAPLKAETTEQSWRNCETHCRTQIKHMQELETENNHLFIEAYGLQDELTPEVPEDQITLARPDREADVKRLISYAIGCMMGRYRLDRPGLIYAHSGNKDFDQIYHHGDTEAQRNDQPKNTSVSPCLCGEYGEFPPDQDGIIPLTETDWFEDDAANRFIEFLKVAWGEGVLAENLKFIADSLDPKRGETPQETLHRYLANRFYKDHLQTYKRRPIYWLFSSGKQGAFQALIYLHRYHEGTLARMRMEYVIPLQGRIVARIEQLEGDISAATSTVNRKKLEKERDTLLKQQAELSAFDDKLRHYADQRIGLDLDEGVKVNYAKFGDLLAEVKAVTGKTEPGEG